MLFRVSTLITLLAVPSFAADYHLSPTGSNAGAGSAEQPWKTFAHAVPLLSAGDTLHLHAGTYPERLVLSGKSGTAEAPIVIRAAENEAPAIDGSALTVPAGGRVGLVVVENCNHVHLRGLEVRNYKTTNAARTPAGIQIEGSGSGLKVLDCKVHNIWQSSTAEESNGFGICVYGTSTTPITGLVVDGNEVHHLRTGQSESLVLNGNVTNFTVSRNHVHDCNNIGIDLIGYEGSAPTTALDRARDGVVRENLVHGIDSAFNPGYGGNFTTGGGDQSAAGIYIDGGTNITVERNRVYGCNFGIELASEAAAGSTDHIRLRNNLLHHNHAAGIIMGGYDHERGTTRNCEVRNNTLYRNDTAKTFGGQITLQFYLEDNTFKNNIVWANEETKQMVVHYVKGGTATERAFGPRNVFDYNLYFCGGNESGIEFGLNPTGNGADQGNKSYNGLAAWRTAVGSDANSVFSNPGFAVAVPGVNPAAADFKITASSFAKDRGDPAFIPAAEEKDFFNASRRANGRVDIGAHEFMTGLQAWRDTHFSLPDGGPPAGNDDDPDADGVRNLVEYSQGMNPVLPDLHLSPAGEAAGSIFRFRYRKQAPELAYQVQSSVDLGAWPAAIPPEQSDGSGSYWRDFPMAGGSRFVRLAVSQ
ncbi:right-handed parallel beta-helix repeat-containing protein [Luteolibacter arcticus]|uniref:Right-handed parallel beta-helix repeat-containing protein n=1 Tax=Luteolibacter arcticus TaxID=1581411 RepID=A0ABT3GEX1_9BACT|nr:right-handed parallel beta-helix repeat-containing protein [Luteolibacter arcticus]MCW1922157.1 right-handed parallel beta-helix repeat-containing protein [Luteolibacter arcticus]